MLRNSPAKLHTILLTLIYVILVSCIFSNSYLLFFKKIFFFQKGKHNQKISSIIPDKVSNVKLYISLYSQYFFFDFEGLKKMLHSVM